ncbi:hypothetical protein AX15_007286 [Amanita polypyramis BW_CC]|nr:hypothetical protein AX15_007286 [Amanita polypyramis BW_CC]
MTTRSVKHEPETPRHIDSMPRPWMSKRQLSTAVANVTRRWTPSDGGGFSDGECKCYSELDGQNNCLTDTTPQCICISLYLGEPGSRHEEILADYPKWDSDMVLHSQRDRDALRAAYADRHNLVLDSTVPCLAPHIVVTPPEQNSQDYYTPWLNATGPQWKSHLMVAIPPNAMDHTLTYFPHQSQGNEQPFVHTAKTVFCLSKFKTFIVSLMRERVVMNNIVNVLQKHCLKAAALAASEIARRFLSCEQYVCPPEKPFHWVDPAEPFLQRRNQFRGTIVIESPTPFSVPHIIINEPPPQDPWIAWCNATTSPQDHGFGRYLTVPHRLVWYTSIPDGSDDYWGSPFPSPLLQAEQFDFEDVDISGSSSSESEPGTPDPDSSMDGFLLDEDGRDFLNSEMQDGENINFFDSCDDSPWIGLINRYSGKATAPMPDDSRSEIKSPILTYGKEDDLPPFDDWYQSVATRNMMTTAV